MITALVFKDVTLYFRNTFLAVISALGLVAYVAIYWLLPAEVADDNYSMALYAEDPTLLNTAAFIEEFKAELLESEDAVISAVDAGDYAFGLVLPAEAVQAAARGEAASVSAYYAPGTPTELRGSLEEIIDLGVNYYLFTQNIADINDSSEVIGPDLIDAPLPMRARLLPTLVMFMFLVEAIGVALILDEDLENGTARAVLVTPLTPGQFFTSKAVMGLGLAFVQVFLLVTVTGQLGSNAWLLALTLLAGSLLIVAVGFFVAALSRGMMSVMGWSMLILLIFTIPALALLFPGIANRWVTFIPSHYLVISLHLIMNFDAGLADVAGNLIALTVVGSLALALSIWMLRRRLA